jgi:type I restriction enzyme, S subunit
MSTVSAVVPVGYKQTEVGVIPEDWNVRKQGDIVDFINGRAYSRHEWETSGVPVCRLQNLTGSGDSFYYSNLKLLEKQYMKFGDLIFMWSASFGPYIWKGPRAIFHYHIWKIECNQKYVDKSFFYHALIDMTERLKSKTSGSTMLHLTKEGMEKYPLALPKFSEQKSIAKVLTDSDSQIQAFEYLISKKRNIKQGTMQELLTGNTRLPGFTEEWENKLLSEIANIKTGSRDNHHKIKDGKYPFFVRSQTVERIDTFSHDCEAILVPGDGKIGSIFHYINGRFDVHQRVYAITKFNSNVCGKYVFYYVANFFGSYALQNTVKATVDSLRLPIFQNFTIHMPSTTNEQEAIAEVLSDMDAEISDLEERLEKAKAIKQGMMQQLLTGKVRLVD